MIHSNESDCTVRNTDGTNRVNTNKVMSDPTNENNDNKDVSLQLHGSNNSISSASSSSKNNNNNNSNSTTGSTSIIIDGIHFVDYTDESQLDHVMSLVGRDLSEPYSIFTYRYFLHRFPHLCLLAIDASTNEPIGCVVGKIDEEDDDDESDDEKEELVTVVESSSPQQQQQQQSEGANEKEQEEEATDGNHQPDTLQPPPPPPSTNATTTTRTTRRRIKRNVGYIGMLAVSEQYRRRGIGKALVQRILYRMRYGYTSSTGSSTGTDVAATFGSSSSSCCCTSVTLETEVTNVTAQLLYQNYFGFIREELLVRYYLNWNDAYRLRLWF